MVIVEWCGFVVGLLLVLGVASGVLSALVLPRRGGGRVQRLVAWLARTIFAIGAHRLGSYERRDRLLALQAPMFLGALLGAWLALFVLGFALMMWPFVAAGGFTHALVISGSSVFTLGFASESGPIPRGIVFVAAATGLIVVALQIAYLPVLYASFNYVQWEQWAADVAESHSTYPVLLYFRSPRPYESWIVGMLAVLDAAALHLATRPLTAPSQARNCLRMGYTGLREMAQTLRIPHTRDPRPDDPIELTREQFDDGLHHLEHVHWPMEREPDEAWIHFRGWRVNYEAIAYGIANAIDAPPALWAGPRFRLPPALQPPDRPAHRAPPGEVVQVRELTRQRRAIRKGDAVPVLHGNSGERDKTWGPM